MHPEKHTEIIAVRPYKTPDIPHAVRQDRKRNFNVREAMGLLAFLYTCFPEKSHTGIKSLLSHGNISVNGKRTTRHDTPLHPGDTVTLEKNPLSLSVGSPVRLVYADDDIIVIDKPHGLLSIATEKERQRTAYALVSELVKREHPGNKVFIVHRLDRETSGLMVLARSQRVQERLQRNWKQLVTDRRYIAVTEGCLQPLEGDIETRLREDRNCRMHVSNDKRGEIAITHYRILRQGPTYSLVELRLETGKKNQIRVHLQWKGTPIAGDSKYGAAGNPVGRLCLHAFRLHIIHPVTGRELDFETPIPESFEKII